MSIQRRADLYSFARQLGRVFPPDGREDAFHFISEGDKKLEEEFRREVAHGLQEMPEDSAGFPRRSSTWSSGVPEKPGRVAFSHNLHV